MRKLEALKVEGGVQREEPKKKTFCELEVYFSSCYYFHYSFSFALQR